jgi:hypothetical protein
LSEDGDKEPRHTNAHKGTSAIPSSVNSGLGRLRRALGACLPGCFCRAGSVDGLEASWGMRRSEFAIFCFLVHFD